MVLFPGFDQVDVFGPLEVLRGLAYFYPMNLSLIAADLKPVSTKPITAAMNPFNSSFGASVNPTHTFGTAPPLDVLIVPGGEGMRKPNMTDVTGFIKRTYPSLKYMITVCTGAGLAAQSGVLDGKRATTNKASWAQINAMGPNVK